MSVLEIIEFVAAQCRIDSCQKERERERERERGQKKKYRNIGIDIANNDLTSAMFTD